MRFDPVEDWHARADSIPGYLDTAIRDKVSRYGARYSDCWLVGYLNIDEGAFRQREIEQVITETMDPIQRSCPRDLRALEEQSLQRDARSCVRSHAQGQSDRPQQIPNGGAPNDLQRHRFRDDPSAWYGATYGMEFDAPKELPGSVNASVVHRTPHTIETCGP